MKTAFVIPFYGDQIAGGAENHCRRLAENLSARGVEVEVLTTTLRDLTSHWNQPCYEPGEYNINGVTVRRFHPRLTDTDLFVPVNRKLMARQAVSVEEELDFANNAINSDAMYQYIGDNKKDYTYFFMPYPFGLSLNGTKIAPEKSCMIPCLHDEGYAEMMVTRKMFDRVNAVLFNSRAEMELAMNLYDGLKHTEPILIGEGVDAPAHADGARFREKFRLGADPFILYVGRRDTTKNTPQLVDYFRRYVKLTKAANLKLVMMGPGTISVPDDIASSVIDMGFAPAQDKADALAGASTLCQPSLMESFSLVIMESWLCGRPALVHSRCRATAAHVSESGGGLAFGSFPEFYESVDVILSNPQLANAMGEKGRRYVKANYGWDVICGRFIRLLGALEKV